MIILGSTILTSSNYLGSTVPFQEPHLFPENVSGNHPDVTISSGHLPLDFLAIAPMIFLVTLQLLIQAYMIS